ncbi:MAG: hypothetical protein F4X83_09995 [Chloroflexi bacterium]|nr:hypothetical protein [Chloroflexota bacterium]
MYRTIVSLVVGVILTLFASATIHASGDCQFVLGFKTLRDLIGHDIVGECLEDQRYAANGNSEQHTTGGLLVWRKADNWTAFTDGYRTWLNGPNGLQQRLNTERFEWEADYADFASPSSVPALTHDALLNAELQTALFAGRFAFNDARVRLRDGIYEDVYRYESNGSILEHPRTTRLWDEHPIAFGDLNGNGIEDAVVIVGIWEGGNIVHKYLTGFRNDDGVPGHVASVLLGANIGIDSMTISGGVVTVLTRRLGLNDPNCCPTREVTLEYQLASSEWHLLREMANQPTPPSAPEMIIWPWNREISADDMLHLQLEKRGLNRSSTMYLFLRDALRLYAYSAYPVYLAYLDSLGVAVKDVGNSENWDNFVYAYLMNSEYRSGVNSTTRKYLETTEYLGPILATFLKGEIYGPLRDKVDFLSLMGNAVWFSYGPGWYRGEGDSWQGECRSGCEKVRDGLVELTMNNDIYSLQRLPNPWKK